MKDVLYLVSYCLLGRNCRYDGGNAEDGSVIKFLRGKRYIPLCPEELGGLLQKNFSWEQRRHLKRSKGL